MDEKVEHPNGQTYRITFNARTGNRTVHAPVTRKNGTKSWRPMRHGSGKSKEVLALSKQK